MNTKDFNHRYSKYLKRGYGLQIENKLVIEFLTQEFDKEIEHFPSFEFNQCKQKLGRCRFYTNSKKRYFWEKSIDKIMGW